VLRLQQAGDAVVEPLVVSMLPGPKVGLVGPGAEAHRVKQGEHPAQPGLQHPYRSNHPRRQVQGQVDALQFVAGALHVKDVLQHRVDESVLGSESPKDRALGNIGGLGDLSGTHLAAELLQQRLSRGDQRGATFVRRQRSGSGHSSILDE
jgi:hypothetical protein